MIHSFSGQLHPHAQELEALAAAIGGERLPAPIAGVATREAQLDEAAAALRKVAGEHVLLDAAGVIAFFSAMTCVVDATGHKNFAIADRMETMVSRVSAIRRRTRGKLLPFVLLASGLLGTFLVSSRLLRRAD
mmetsp:Transcript_99498/g.319287  ORF Transcript_99498/g.319287 Transcript_99498/m.319287 type:complete len:133 (+) Transcript_99498:1008-1406(+)